MFAPHMRSRRAIVAAAVVAVAAFAASACGGSGATSQSATSQSATSQSATTRSVTTNPATAQSSGSFPVQVTRATFPRFQRLAQRTALTIRVRNAGAQPIPNVAVTITNPRYGTSVLPFATSLDMPGLSSHSRPVWIVLRAPGPCGYSCHQLGAGGAVTASANTWALGTLNPGATATFVWGVTAVKAGTFRVAYRVAADLTGGARAVLANGSPATGTFTIHISATPPREVVTPGGQVIQVG